ncbi:MAG TPA: VanZ family protein [Gemmatimonadales bacterium]
MKRRTPHLAPRILGIALSVLAIGIATLHSAGTELPPGWTLALVAGDEALAEVVQNVLLFIPFGVALALAGWPTTALRLVALGTVLSFCVEFAQQWIPGRDPSLGDLVFNTLGTALGLFLVRRAHWLSPTAPRAAWRSLAVALGAAAVWLGTGWLIHPTFPASTYVDRWTPDIPHWALYRGQVLSAALGTTPLAQHPIPGSELRHTFLDARGRLRVLAVAGPAPPRPAPVLAIDDIHGRDVLVLAVDGADVVLRPHNHAAEWTLARPNLRVAGGLAGIAPGDTFALSTWRDRLGYCVAQGARPWCRLWYTLGDGWRLIFFPQHFPATWLLALNALWIAGWTFGVGWWARPHLATFAALGVTAAVLLAGPGLVGLLATPGTEILGGVAGVVGGWLAQKFLRFAQRAALSS